MASKIYQKCPKKFSRVVTEARAGLIPESDWAANTKRQANSDDNDRFIIPPDIRRRAAARTDRIMIKPATLIALMDEADEALNGDSNDAEHDALFSIREQLSELYESGD